MELNSGKFLKKTELKGWPISCWAVLNWRLMFLLPFCIIITKPFDFHCLLFTAKMAVASGELQSSRPKFLKILCTMVNKSKLDLYLIGSVCGAYF